ncbi:MAG TPA: hypothetical protein VLX92_19020 [Kofleriaceae bacterium]|nr:hypothetical protein [Kofleriaceae bacterium]
MRRSACCALLALAACEGEPAASRAVARGAAPVARDAARVVVADAARDGCRAGEPVVHAFRFGTLAAPAGWCWRRTAEGDDLSGVVLDDQGRVRARYDELAFDGKVGDACARGRAIRAATQRGVAYRACELADGRHCVSFHGQANLCSEPPDDTFSLHDLIATLGPARGRP